MIEITAISRYFNKVYDAGGLPTEKELCKLIEKVAADNGFSGKIKIKQTTIPYSRYIKRRAD